MSWDIFVQDLPKDAKSTSDIPEDFKPRSIGKRAEMIREIRLVVPSANFSDPSWGRIDGDEWSVEVNLGEDEEVKSFAFHVRGGDAAVGVVSAILSHLRLRALDSQTGEFFEAGPQALDSFRQWNLYRDQICDDPDA